MKRVICVIVLICLSFTLFGCSKSTDNKPNSKKQLQNEVLQCFIDNDTETLKNMFCATSQRNQDLENEIEKAMHLIDGEICDYSFSRSSESKSVDDGELSLYEYSLQIDEIKTTAGETYLISFGYREVCLENPNSIGIMSMSVYKKNENSTDA
ncbi:MAG: DUF5104 domain-containing protein, partial [Oscillospiraceae bacterium]|nr:DUF5104 domain-containing protein [Oscillospiraceae bacterium]